MAARPKINYGLAATLLAQGAHTHEIFEQVGAKTANSLKVGLFKKGVTLARLKNLPIDSPVTQSATLRIANRAGELLRETFGSILAKHTDELAKVPARANLKQIQRVGAALEPLVRSAEKVHNWNQGEKPTLNLNLITETRLEDLQSANPTPQIVSDIPDDTTIRSVQELEDLH